MEKIFIKIKITNDLSKIILRYLTKSQNSLLNEKSKNFNIKEIIKYDSKLIVNIKDKLNKNTIAICAKYGNLQNMKWLFKNDLHMKNEDSKKCTRLILGEPDESVRTFAYAAENGKIENMKWLLKNKFPYDKSVFIHAVKSGNLETMKWLLEKEFPYDADTYKTAVECGNSEIIKWLLEKGFPREHPEIQFWSVVYGPHKFFSCDRYKKYFP